MELIGDEPSASQSGRFAPWERVSGAHRIGDWVGPKAGLDAVANKKIPCPR